MWFSDFFNFHLLPLSQNCVLCTKNPSLRPALQFSKFMSSKNHPQQQNKKNQRQKKWNKKKWTNKHCVGTQKEHKDQKENVKNAITFWLLSLSKKIRIILLHFYTTFYTPHNSRKNWWRTNISSKKPVNSIINKHKY